MSFIQSNPQFIVQVNDNVNQVVITNFEPEPNQIVIDNSEAQIVTVTHFGPAGVAGTNGSGSGGTVNTSSLVQNSQTSSMSVATASYWSGSILNVLSSSYSRTSSYWSGSIINAQSSSYWSGSIINVLSSSFATTASYALNVPVLNTSSFATTGSNTFRGNEIISGSLIVTGGITGSSLTGSLTGSLLGTSSWSIRPWVLTGSAIYYNSGSVLIGTNVFDGSLFKIQGPGGTGESQIYFDDINDTIGIRAGTANYISLTTAEVALIAGSTIISLTPNHFASNVDATSDNDLVRYSQIKGRVDTMYVQIVDQVFNHGTSVAYDYNGGSPNSSNTILANTAQVGQTYKIRGKGIWTNTSSEININPILGNVSLGNINFIPPAIIADAEWSLEIDIVVRDNSMLGSVVAVGSFNWSRTSTSFRNALANSSIISPIDFTTNIDFLLSVDLTGWVEGSLTIQSLTIESLFI
jgi:hypothetical protein